MNLLARLKRLNRPEEDVDLPDLAGKILVIYTSSEGIGGGIFQDARFVSIAFTVFVVGRRVDLELSLQPRWSRATIRTSIHHISQMLVFDDLESARAAFERGDTELESDSV